MLEPIKPDNEEARIEALQEYQILDSLPEQDFDSITKIASQICGTPISLITLVDNDRQWFKSRYGMDDTETDRTYSFCAHAILNPEIPFIVPDADNDDRFSDNPLTTGAPFVKFYAGIPLLNPEGFPLGSLCVIDNKARSLSDSQLQALRALAHQVVQLLELRKTVAQLHKTQKELERANRNLNEFAYLMAHDIKAPIRQVSLISEIFTEEFKENLNEDGRQLLERLSSSAGEATKMVNGILKYSRSTHFMRRDRSEVDMNRLMPHIISRIEAPDHIQIQYPQQLPTLKISNLAIQQILTNLISNAVKYNDKVAGLVQVDCEHKPDSVVFRISDNGRGMAPEALELIFTLFYRTNVQDSEQNNSSGVGLAIVKRLVGDLEGTIRVHSVLGEGSQFEIELPTK